MNYAYLDQPSKREIRRKVLKALCLPGRQVPFSAPELPIAYGWGVGGMAITAALLEPADRLKVVDHGSDDTVNALNIRGFFERTAKVSATTSSAEATIIQTRQRVPEAALHDGQILVYQVPRPDPLRGFTDDAAEARRRHAQHDYGVVLTTLFEVWLHHGETSLGYDHPVTVDGGALMSPSPIPAMDNLRMNNMAAIQIFGAARERRLYALPAHTRVESLAFRDLPCVPPRPPGACAICSTDVHYLDNIGTDAAPKWVCSDSESCRIRADV
ncbi:alpha-D-ribose 1-methylphosphonate 5-phosphate C-P-lyase PhnJ [Paracoccus sp. TOH]|uniref:alpha-D-ribose 1-methylphosphonate 5-phosphate C-P-lyase PhnJ n=1 Tax=Paracoccus sp. TOH TaxID=1263728 RepID=UPI0025B06D16|nr:alpha-D-ribose 1-methylphosphonate 5-phosphate C-P-lyase PhnJ [Paracoccus sp. TOH]WJS85276.1 alpha-D-ribose 1-methylphosphonate 5-phosphate C-P-lyase PhnJ [Paracoccus sp. TOH]